MNNKGTRKLIITALVCLPFSLYFFFAYYIGRYTATVLSDSVKTYLDYSVLVIYIVVLLYAIISAVRAFIHIVRDDYSKQVILALAICLVTLAVIVPSPWRPAADKIFESKIVFDGYADGVGQTDEALALRANHRYETGNASLSSSKKLHGDGTWYQYGKTIYLTPDHENEKFLFPYSDTLIVSGEYLIPFFSHPRHFTTSDSGTFHLYVQPE